MRGYQVLRKAGWDTHGLPVEIALEKTLGFKQKSDIEAYGVAKFNAKAKELVYHHIESQDSWRTLTERMGYWVNLDEAYITCTNEYIESVWWALKEFFNKGLIYKGYKIIPQCPHCETPLSSHELALGYKDVKDPSIFITCTITEPAHVRRSPIGAKLLVWTTTPWTLISNVALAINPRIEYVAIRYENETIVCAKERLSVFAEKEMSIIREFKGEALFVHGMLNCANLPLSMPKISRCPDVLPGKFVTTEDGSGIVHIRRHSRRRLCLTPIVPSACQSTVTNGGRFINFQNDRLNLITRFVKDNCVRRRRRKRMRPTLLKTPCSRHSFKSFRKNSRRCSSDSSIPIPRWRCGNPLISTATRLMVPSDYRVCTENDCPEFCHQLVTARGWFGTGPAIGWRKQGLVALARSLLGHAASHLGM